MQASIGKAKGQSIHGLSAARAGTMTNADMKLIDGELFVSGKILIRLTLGVAVARPKSPQGQLFLTGVMPLLKRKNLSLWNEVTALITRLGEIKYRFKIRRGMQTVEGMNPFCLLPEVDQEQIDDLCHWIDCEVGLAEIMRAMRFNPVNMDGSPIAS
jgi:hypothetical protein